MLNQANWTTVKTEYQDWWNKQRQSPLCQISAPLEGMPAFEVGYPHWGFVADPNHPDRVIESFIQLFEHTWFGGQAFPNLWQNLGPGSLAAYYTDFLGYNAEAQTVWFEKDMKSWETIMQYQVDPPNRWYQYNLDIAEMIVEKVGEQCVVAVSDLGGILDILASLRGTQQLLMDLIESPDKVHEAREKIVEDWHKVFDRLGAIIKKNQDGSSAWMGIWSPGKSYPLQCDFSAMISPRMFAEFVAPDLGEQARRLDYSIYHLDGPGELPHLEMILDIDEIDGIQWVPGSGVEQVDSERWLDIYYRILERDKLLVLQYPQNPEDMVRLIERLPNPGRVLTTLWVNDQTTAKEYADRILSVR